MPNLSKIIDDFVESSKYITTYLSIFIESEIIIDYPKVLTYLGFKVNSISTTIYLLNSKWKLLKAELCN